MLTKGQLKKEVKVVLSGDIVSIVYLFDRGDKEIQIQKADYIYDEVIKIFDADKGKKYKLLIDISRLANLEFLPREIRMKYVEMAKDKHFKAVAVVGGNRVLRVIAGFIMKASGRSEGMKIFDDKQSAIRWLKQK